MTVMSVTLTLTETDHVHQILSEGQQNSVVAENGEEEDAREAELIIFEETTQGLGLKICGGCSADGKEDYGIFVKRVLPGGLAERVGGISEADLLLEVNGQSMEGVTYERAVSMLRQASASNHVEMVITRDAESRAEFSEYVHRFGSVQSPITVPDHQASEYNIDLHRKMNSMVQDTSLNFHEVGDTNDLNNSGKSNDINGHVSPASSCASEVANHMVDSGQSPRLQLQGSRGARDTPSDYLDSLLSKKLSQDPGLKLHIDQLEAALVNLGLHLSPSKQSSLRQSLTVDHDGMVRFEEFVDVAKQIFHNDLDTLKSTPPPQLPKQNTNTLLGGGSELSEVIRERDALRAEVAALKEEMQHRNQSSQNAEEQLLFIRKQAQVSIEDCRSLKSKLHLAEQAQAKAQQTERDYEEVVAMLENEVSQLRLQMSKSDGVNMQKRLAVLVCQLKKAESGKKTYEVATEKLMRHVEHSVDTLAAMESPRNARGADGKANRKKAVADLATEGRDVIKTVRSLMETVPLPFGWEEAYTSEGVKYYINHLNQTTTWTHPVSCMEHQTSAKTSQQQQEQQHQHHYPVSPAPPPPPPPLQQQPAPAPRQLQTKGVQPHQDKGKHSPRNGQPVPIQSTT